MKNAKHKLHPSQNIGIGLGGSGVEHFLGKNPFLSILLKSVHGKDPNRKGPWVQFPPEAFNSLDWMTMPEKLKEEQKRFAKRLTHEGMDKTAAQYEAMRLIKDKEHFEAKVKIALHQFKNPVEGVEEFPHTEGMKESIKTVFHMTKEELQEELKNEHVSRILVRDVLNDLIAKRKIHNRDWDPTRDHNQLRVENLLSRAKTLREKKEKQRKEIFGKD